MNIPQSVYPTLVITLSAWGATKVGEIRAYSNRVMFPLMRWEKLPKGPWEAELWLHTVWRSQQRMLHLDVFGLDKQFSLTTTHQDFDETWYFPAPLGDIRLPPTPSTGWFRGQVSAVTDYWEQVHNYGLVLLPYVEGVTHGVSCDQALLILRR